MVTSYESFENLFGLDCTESIVAVTPLKEKLGKVKLYIRNKQGELFERIEHFSPFVWLKKYDFIKELNITYKNIEELEGHLPVKYLMFFEDFQSYNAFFEQVKKKSRNNKTILESIPKLLALRDPVEQFLAFKRKTFFSGLDFQDIVRMQIDIETITETGYEFPNPYRDGDKIAIIALSDSSGWEHVLFDKDGNEKRLLEEFIELVQKRNPDVIEGYNIYSFDLPYILVRASKNNVKLYLGRDGSEITSHQSRFTVGERVMTFQKFYIEGRSIVDIYFLLLAYDVSHRSLEGNTLKDAAVHFHVVSPNRTYIPGEKISETIKKNIELVVKYALDDVRETKALSDILSSTYFAQAKVLPIDYQNVCLRGNAVKIESLLLREYLKCRHSLPDPSSPKSFTGGYTDIFAKGVVNNVCHCDVRSLYPSIMLIKNIAPRNDALSIFSKLLKKFTDFRIKLKKSLPFISDSKKKVNVEAMQSAFKILINSFYGYLGCPQATFSDFDAAEMVTSEGRKVIKHMIDFLKQKGAYLVEADTDGIYYVPPSDVWTNQDKLKEFQNELQSSLPKGIVVEFDEEYEAMFSYKMKNYALLTKDNEIIIKGAALRSRGLEPYLRDFMREYLMFKLKRQDDKIPELLEKYKSMIRNREYPISKLAKTETLNESVQAYLSKVTKGSRSRSAAYELAIKTGRDYQAGDRISYYITGSKAKVTAFQNAKMVCDFDESKRDENVEYYIAKLDSLFTRLQKGELEDNDEDEID